MTNNTQNTAQNIVAEQHEQSKQQRLAASLTERAIRSFVAQRIADPKHGAAFFNRVTQNGCNELELHRDFMKHVDREAEFSERSDAFSQALKKVNMRQFFNFTVSVGAGFENNRRVLKSIISTRYSFGDAVMHGIFSDIETQLSLETLTSTIQSESKRMQYLRRFVSSKDLIAHERDSVEELEHAFAGKSLTEHQKNVMLRLMTSSSVRPDEVNAIMGLFSSTEEKQLLIKLFLPHVSLADLEKAGIISHHQVVESIELSITQGNLKEKFRNIDPKDIHEIAQAIDPESIMIETYLFPDTVVNAIVSSA